MAIGVPPQSGVHLAPDVPTEVDDVALDSPPPAEQPARVFYRIDSRRVTLREYWWGNPASVVPAAVFKLFGVRISSPSDDPCVETLAPFEVAPHEVPGLVAQRLALPIHQLTSLGFRAPLWHVVDDDVQQAKTYLATLAHASGRAWARVHSRIWLVHTPPTTKTFFEIVTETAPGGFLWSLSSKADLAAPSSCTIIRKVNATPTALWNAHQAALQKSKAQALVQVTEPNALRASVERHHQAVREFHVQRGVFAPLTADEHATAQSFRESITAAQGTGSKYPEILAEIDRLQAARSSGKSGFILLLASLGLFVLAGLKGMGGLSIEMLAILVGVLFVHELGHWVAMRVFGYRNLKMFFIPFFGAAVSGRHYNVPGWKKAVVSFAGPLPGIVLGAALGFAGASMGQPLLLKIGVTAVLLNGFNLLPVLPLDGGWILQAILLSRHHLIELLFRIGAIVALVVTAALLDDPVTRYLAIFMAIALPAMHKQARITNELRKAKLAPVSDDDQTIPAPTAEAIIERVKAGFPKSLTNKNAAQFTLQIFENLNARPPGLWVSLGLGALQIVSLLATVLIASGLYLAMGKSIIPDMKYGAERALDPGSVAIVRAPNDSAYAAAPPDLVLATFEQRDSARVVMEALGRRRHASLVGLGHFGHTAVVAIAASDSATRGAIEAELEGMRGEIVVSSAKVPAAMRLSCVASPANAAAIDEELSGYLLPGSMYLVPPWYPGDTRSAEERMRHANARRTYLQLANLTLASDTSHHVVALRSQLYSAKAKGDAEPARVRAELDSIVAAARDERARAIGAFPGIDTAVMRVLQATESERADYDEERTEAPLAPLLGQLPVSNGRPAPGTESWSVSGQLLRQGDTLRLSTLGFDNVLRGAPALIGWLHARGCGDLRYSLASGVDFSKLDY